MHACKVALLEETFETDSSPADTANTGEHCANNTTLVIATSADTNRNQHSERLQLH